MTTPKLSRRLLLESEQRFPDGAGGFDRVWLTLGELWAEVTPLSAREGVFAEAPVSISVMQVVVRGAPIGDLARPRADQRFRDGSRIYRILAVTEHDPRGHYLRCKTEEEVIG